MSGSHRLRVLQKAIAGTRRLRYSMRFRMDRMTRIDPIHSVFFIWEKFMTVKYKHEGEVLSLVRSFEEATISRNDWKHAEHLVVALYYLTHHDLETATAKMRDGIFNLLTKGFDVDLTKEMPYHETMTIFWMRTVNEYNRLQNGASLLEKANEVAYKWNKDYPLRFYTRERLFSDEARARFIDGDLESVD